MANATRRPRKRGNGEGTIYKGRSRDVYRVELKRLGLRGKHHTQASRCHPRPVPGPGGPGPARLH